MIALFWLTGLLLAYGYVGYPLVVISLAGLRRPQLPTSEPPAMTATLLITAHNEAAHMPAKLRNALDLEVAPHRLEIVVVSDGSSDDTVAKVRGFDSRGVRLIEIEEHIGKVAALNQGLAATRGEIVVFSDANSLFRRDSVRLLLRHFADQTVGGVCGRLAVPGHKRNWLGLAEALYWDYDNALKQAESVVGGSVSAQGSLYAVRRELLSALPPAVADDLVNSLRVVAQGKRLVFEPGAVSEEPVSGDPSQEFRRRVRSTEQGFRGLLMMARLLNPFRFGFYSVQLFSHKVLRRLTPFFLLLFLVSSLALVAEHAFYATVAALQAVFYGLAGAAWSIPPLRRLPGLGLPLFFVMGHLAMGLGVLNVLRGRRTERWSPARNQGEA